MDILTLLWTALSFVLSILWSLAWFVLRDLISTLTQLNEKQRMAGVAGDDADLFGYHFENQRLAVNLFHMRGGRVLDRRELEGIDPERLVTLHEHAIGEVATKAELFGQCRGRARTLARGIQG